MRGARAIGWLASSTPGTLRASMQWSPLHSRSLSSSRLSGTLALVVAHEAR